MKKSLNVERLLSVLSEILSERAGVEVKVMKGEMNHDVSGNEEISKVAL